MECLSFDQRDATTLPNLSPDTKQYGGYSIDPQNITKDNAERLRKCLVPLSSPFYRLSLYEILSKTTIPSIEGSLIWVYDWNHESVKNSEPHFHWYTQNISCLGSVRSIQASPDPTFTPTDVDLSVDLYYGDPYFRKYDGQFSLIDLADDPNYSRPYGFQTSDTIEEYKVNHISIISDEQICEVLDLNDARRVALSI